MQHNRNATRQSTSNWQRLSYLFTGLLLVLAFAACAAPYASQPTPSPTASPLLATSGTDVVGTASPAPEGQVRDTILPYTQTYQWTGTVAAGSAGEFTLVRDCDSWALQPQNADVKAKLAAYAGLKVLVWGTVIAQPLTSSRLPAIAVTAVFGPNDPVPMTLIAIPDYSCPPYPTPTPVSVTPIPYIRVIDLQQGEIAFRGALVWENGQPFLSTPAGKITLTLPTIQLPGLDAGSAAGGQAPAQANLMDVVAAGTWRLNQGALSLAARTLQPWPVNVAVNDPCLGQVSLVQLQSGELEAVGELASSHGQYLLQTSSGNMQVALATGVSVPNALPASVAAAGKWSLDASGLHLFARALRVIGQPCPPPPTPTPSLPGLLPGEIAAVGALMWQNSQPYLETPSGRILLMIPADVSAPSAEGYATPGTATSGVPAYVLQVLAIGKWSIQAGQLTIAVRTLQPWPADIILPPTPTPTPFPPPGVGQGTVYGKVTIGPLCPVEPCPGPTPDVYSSRPLIFQSTSGASVSVPLNADGSFKVALKADTYSVNLTDCTYLGCRYAMPKSVTVIANQAVQFNIAIDTGIR